MATSVFKQHLGAFINLESTGPLGVPIMFQHTGSWTASVYAASAVTPRGTSMSQDFFESGLIPADTDYKMFSSRYQGTLPGIDIAFVLGGSMYHTPADSLENIRRGTVQELGNNMMGVTRGFTAELARQALGSGDSTGTEETLATTADITPPDAPSKAGAGVATAFPALFSKHDDHDAAYYFDVFWLMVVYPKRLAHFLHNAPLAMMLLAPLQMRSMSDPPPLQYAHILRASFAYIAAVVAAVLIPATAGALRALLSARPLVFFSHHLAAYALHAPLALAAMLCAGAMVPRLDVPTATMGAAWVWGALGVAATRAQLGAAIYPFLWTAPVLLAITATCSRGPAMQLTALLVCSCASALVGTTSGMTLVEHVMDKINLLGAHDALLGTVLADVAVGGVLGLAVVLATGVLAPAVGAVMASCKVLGRVVVCLLCVALVGGVVSSTLSPYDATHQKRVFCQHLHTVRDGRVVDSRWVVTTTDPYPTLPAKQPMRWTTRVAPLFLSNSKAGLSTDPLLLRAVPADAVMKRYLHPLSALLHGVALPAPGPADDLLPAVNVIAKHGARRDVEVNLGRPCWGLINISAPAVSRWSFTEELTSIAPGQHLVRFAGNGGGERLRFWVEADPGVPVRVELTAKYFDHEGPVAEFGRQQFGGAPWVAFTGLLVYHVDMDIA